MRSRIFIISLVIYTLLSIFDRNLIFSQNNFSGSKKSVQVQQIINEVNIDSLLFFVKQLSGETTVRVGKDQVKIASRHASQPGNEQALIYLQNKLASYGLDPVIQTSSASCRNIYAIQKGIKYPDVKLILCAHYDDISSKNDVNSIIAPGADDNASGTAAVIEAARIFSKYKFDYSIVFALWDEEEQGMIGSKYFAKMARSVNDSIIGVINIDMIAWDYNNDNLVEVHTKSTYNSVFLAEYVLNFNLEYKINLAPVIRNPGTTSSDHSSFWSYFYSSILIIENYYGDFNSKYHTTNDLLYYFNIPYFEKCAKLSIGALAKLANRTTLECCKIGDNNHGAFSLKQNYPNPFNPSTVITFQINKETDLTFTGNKNQNSVCLEVFDILGRKVNTLLDNKSLSPGIYSINWDGKDKNGYKLQSGVYFYSLRAGRFSETRQMYLLK